MARSRFEVEYRNDHTNFVPEGFSPYSTSFAHLLRHISPTLIQKRDSIVPFQAVVSTPARGPKNGQADLLETSSLGLCLAIGSRTKKPRKKASVSYPYLSG